MAQLLWPEKTSQPCRFLSCPRKFREYLTDSLKEVPRMILIDNFQRVLNFSSIYLWPVIAKNCKKLRNCVKKCDPCSLLQELWNFAEENSHELRFNLIKQKCLLARVGLSLNFSSPLYNLFVHRVVCVYWGKIFVSGFQARPPRAHWSSTHKKKPEESLLGEYSFSTTLVARWMRKIREYTLLRDRDGPNRFFSRTFCLFLSCFRDSLFTEKERRKETR